MPHLNLFNHNIKLIEIKHFLIKYTKDMKIQILVIGRACEFFDQLVTFQLIFVIFLFLLQKMKVHLTYREVDESIFACTTKLPATIRHIQCLRIVPLHRIRGSFKTIYLRF